MTATNVSPAHEAYLSQRFFGSLNGLRFVCIVAVMWHHSPLNGAAQNVRLLERGFVGVDFFFVLSGFLITTLLLREEARKGRISLRGFYWRRALRILPVYLLLVTAMSIYWIVVKGQSDPGYVPYYYLFLANFLKGDIPLLSITWSLSVEEQYYLLWPAALIVLPTMARFRVGVLVLAIFLCLLAMLGLADWLNLPVIETEHARFVLPGMSYSAILMGSLAAVCLHRPRGFRVLYGVTAWRGAPVVYFGVLALYLHLVPANLLGWPAFGMDILMVLTLASLVVREDHVLRPVMAWRPVARIGEISYGLYLYHLIGRHIATEIAHALNVTGFVQDVVISLLFAVFSILLAEVSFRFFESHFLKLKAWPSRRRQAAVVE